MRITQIMGISTYIIVLIAEQILKLMNLLMKTNLRIHIGKKGNYENR